MPSIAKKISKFTQLEIESLFHNARRSIKNSALTILLAPRQKNFARVLIVTSRKIGNAPQRNLIRRRIKSIFYQEKLFENPFDYVVISHKDMTSLSFNELKDFLILAYNKTIESNENNHNK